VFQKEPLPYPFKGVREGKGRSTPPLPYLLGGEMGEGVLRSKGKVFKRKKRVPYRKEKRK